MKPYIIGEEGTESILEMYKGHEVLLARAKTLSGETKSIRASLNGDIWVRYGGKDTMKKIPTLEDTLLGLSGEPWVAILVLWVGSKRKTSRDNPRGSSDKSVQPKGAR